MKEMKKNLKLLLLISMSCFVFCVVCSMAVNAAPDKQKAATVIVSNSVDLEKAINDATEDITISVGTGFELTEQIRISNNHAIHIKIVGDSSGAILTKAATARWSRHFIISQYVDGVTWTFENVVLDGRNDYGGFSIKTPVNSGDKLTINGLNIQNCEKEDYGGAIKVDGLATKKTNVTFRNTTVDSCVSNLGGGAVYTFHSDVVFDDLTIDKSNCKLYGGAITLNSGTNATIKNAKITNCYSVSHGGAIAASDFLAGPATVTLTMTDTVIENCTITEQTGYGGAVFLRGNGSALNMQNTEINKCSTNQFGGGIYASANTTVNLTKTTMDNNSAGKGGGAICTGTGTVLNTSHSTIKTCTAGSSGGGIFATTKTVMSLNDTAIQNTVAKTHGGGIYTSDEVTLNARNLEIRNCKTDTFGGALFASTGSAVKLENSKITENKARNGGGAICVTGETGLTIADSTISKSESDTFGGGIHISGKANVAVKNTEIAENTAKSGGGAVCTSGEVQLNIENSTISNCKTDEYGGGIFASAQSVVTLKHMKMAKNTAVQSGGAVCVNLDVKLNIENSEINSCTAGEFGGGIYMIDNAVTNLKNTTLKNNVAPEGGGAICALARSNLHADKNVVFENNKADKAYRGVKQADINTHKTNILTKHFSFGFEYGYNNYDIYYTEGQVETRFYKVQLDTNGGKADSAFTKEYTYVHGALITEPKVTITKDGKNSLGWYYKNKRWNFKTDRVTGNMVLTATWPSAVSDTAATGDQTPVIFLIVLASTAFFILAKKFASAKK